MQKLSGQPKKKKNSSSLSKLITFKECGLVFKMKQHIIFMHIRKTLDDLSKQYGAADRFYSSEGMNFCQSQKRYLVEATVRKELVIFTVYK